MGGKGGSSSPPELQRNVPSMGGEMEALMGLFEGMMGMNMGLINTMSEMSQQQDIIIPEVPSVMEAPEINWEEEQDKIRAKMTADQSVKDKQKRSRASTVHTSPLLDNDDAETTKSLLGN